jgi:hypothetical protein
MLILILSLTQWRQPLNAVVHESYRVKHRIGFFCVAYQVVHSSRYKNQQPNKKSDLNSILTYKFRLLCPSLAQM